MIIIIILILMIIVVTVIIIYFPAHDELAMSMASTRTERTNLLSKMHHDCTSTGLYGYLSMSHFVLKGCHLCLQVVDQVLLGTRAVQ